MKRNIPWIVALLAILVAMVAVMAVRAGWFSASDTEQSLAIPAESADGGGSRPSADARTPSQKQVDRSAKLAPATAAVPLTTTDYAPPPAGITLSWAAIAILLMAVVAAALIGGLVVGWWIKDPSGQLDAFNRRIKSLEDWRKQQEPSPEPRKASEDRDPYAIYRTPLREAPPPPPPVPSRARELKNAPRPAPPVPLSQIGADYRRLLSGTMSRSSFQNFFDGIGDSGSVQLTSDRASIEAASGESFLTAVTRDSAILVFPSYDFASNAANQFSTIASVPEAVSILFNLERDDGEIVMERPAIFDHDGDRPILRSKGIIRGFDG